MTTIIKHDPKPPQPTYDLIGLTSIQLYAIKYGLQQLATYRKNVTSSAYTAELHEVAEKLRAEVTDVIA